MNLRNQMIYQVYLRNHTPEGTFKSLIDDLDRIKALGTDIVHFLPIYPIGQKKRKGTLGSPYSISDYKGVNPEHGTIGDFRLLVETMHQKGLKVMIDIVFNHTSHDALLIEKFPNSYHRDENGEVAPKVADWWDIADLHFNDEKLEEELIDSLLYWIEVGVDGFRCDVASMVPLAFWRKAEAAVREKNPEVIWFAETVDPWYASNMKELGAVYETDSSMYDVFDMQYSYDIWHLQREHLLGERPLKDFVEGLQLQEFYLPLYYNKVRFLENHDQDRFMSYGLDPEMYTAMMFFLKGTTLVYGGQEFLSSKRPSLFDKDTIERNEGDISSLISVLASLKKDPIFAEGHYRVDSIDECMISSYKKGNRTVYGVFNTKGDRITTEFPDGEYENLITGKTVRISNHIIDWDFPVIFEA